MGRGMRLLMKIILRMWEFIVILADVGRRNDEFLMRINNIMQYEKSDKELNVLIIIIVVII